MEQILQEQEDLSTEYSDDNFHPHIYIYFFLLTQGYGHFPNVIVKEKENLLAHKASQLSP